VKAPAELLALRGRLAEAAQTVVDAWGQDEDGFDEELGTGGPCDRVADAMSGVLAEALPDAEVEDGGQDGDDHAFLLVTLGGERFIVDVPPRVYEVGGGYSWKKIPGARISEDDVVVEPAG
jgi:hypothetical protein